MEAPGNVCRSLAASVVHVSLLVSGTTGISTGKTADRYRHRSNGLSDLSARATASVGTPDMGCTPAIPPAFVSHVVRRHNDRTVVRIDPCRRTSPSRNEEGVRGYGRGFPAHSCPARRILHWCAVGNLDSAGSALDDLIVAAFHIHRDTRRRRIRVVAGCAAAYRGSTVHS